MRDRRDSGPPRFQRSRPAPDRRDDAGAKPRDSYQPRGDRDRYPAARTDLVFGVEPVRELALAAPEIIRTLYIRGGEERRFDEEVARVKAAGGNVACADEAELTRNCGRDARHQGIAAVVREYQYADLDAMLEGKPDPILLIDCVTDPRNLGALLRSAEGAGVSNIVIAKDRTVGLTPAAVKSSAGAWIHL